MLGCIAAGMAALFVGVQGLPAAAAPVQTPEVMPDGTVFDGEYYASGNPDVVRVYGTDTTLLYQHYVTYGKSEGRLPYEGYKEGAAIDVTVMDGSSDVPDGSVFDPAYYAAANPDVAAVYGASEQRLYMHYMSYGRYEGRRACAPGKESVSVYNTAINDPAYSHAKAVLDTVGWDLRNAFKWSAGLTYYGHGKADMPENGSPGTRWFAEFGFTKLKGNCYVMAATFYEMAKLMHYEPRQMTGLVPSRHGGLTPHSWVEIDIQGVTYVFDPDFTYGTGRNGYMIQYRQSGTWRYEQYTQMSE